MPIRQNRSAAETAIPRPRTGATLSWNGDTGQCLFVSFVSGEHRSCRRARRQVVDSTMAVAKRVGVACSRLATSSGRSDNKKPGSAVRSRAYWNAAVSCYLLRVAMS